MMLNTDLHNPNIKTHMREDQFIRLTQNADAWRPEYLRALYQQILVNPLRMDRNEGDGGTLFIEPAVRGWVTWWRPRVFSASGALSPRPERASTAAAAAAVGSGAGGMELVAFRYWAVLTFGAVYLFSDTDDTQPLAMIAIEPHTRATPVDGREAVPEEEVMEEEKGEEATPKETGATRTREQLQASAPSPRSLCGPLACLSLPIAERIDDARCLALSGAPRLKMVLMRSPSGVLDISTSTQQLIQVDHAIERGVWLRAIRATVSGLSSSSSSP
jgi:hypothetical protein